LKKSQARKKTQARLLEGYLARNMGFFFIQSLVLAG
jgi:hypothetical protein